MLATVATVHLTQVGIKQAQTRFLLRLDKQVVQLTLPAGRRAWAPKFSHPSPSIPMLLLANPSSTTFGSTAAYFIEETGTGAGPVGGACGEASGGQL